MLILMVIYEIVMYNLILKCNGIDSVFVNVLRFLQVHYFKQLLTSLLHQIFIFTHTY